MDDVALDPNPLESSKDQQLQGKIFFAHICLNTFCSIFASASSRCWVGTSHFKPRKESRERCVGSASSISPSREERTLS
jgi:hypothetical protein